MIIAFEVIVNNMFAFYKNNINISHLYLSALKLDTFLGLDCLLGPWLQTVKRRFILKYSTRIGPVLHSGILLEIKFIRRGLSAVDIGIKFQCFYLFIF